MWRKIRRENNLKAYKLNKTFENSIYPLQQELKEINNNTISSALNNLAGVLFGGVGTSLLFLDECLPKALELLYKWLRLNEFLKIALDILIVIILFVILYALGGQINKKIRSKSELYKKKRTDDGRSDLKELFHKSIINDIVTGLSFVDKAEEMSYKGSVATMYLYEATYYFTEAKLQIEDMKLIDSEKSKDKIDLINLIGKETIISTLKVFYQGLRKLSLNMPEGTEKLRVKSIKKSINSYIVSLQRLKG